MLKILVVDDEHVARRLVEKTLTRLGHTIVLAKSGEDAWKKMQDEHLRLVITDWNMPIMDEIREQEVIDHVLSIQHESMLSLTDEFIDALQEFKIKMNNDELEDEFLNAARHRLSIPRDTKAG